MAAGSEDTGSDSPADELSQLIKDFSDASGLFEGKLILLVGVVRSEPFQWSDADWEPETGYQVVVLGGVLASINFVYRSEPPISLIVMPKASEGEALESFKMLANRAGQFLQRHGRQKDGTPWRGSQPAADWVTCLVTELWKSEYVARLSDERFRINHPFAASAYLLRQLSESKSLDQKDQPVPALRTNLFRSNAPRTDVEDSRQITKADVIRAIILVHHFEDGTFRPDSQSLTLDEMASKLNDADKDGKLSGKSATQISRDLNKIIPPNGMTTYRALLQTADGRATLLKMLEPDELKRAFGTTGDADLHAKHDDARDAKDFWD